MYCTEREAARIQHKLLKQSRAVVEARDEGGEEREKKSSIRRGRQEIYYTVEYGYLHQTILSIKISWTDSILESKALKLKVLKFY